MLHVVLVLGLGLPEIAGRLDFGDDLPRPQADASASAIVSSAMRSCSGDV